MFAFGLSHVSLMIDYLIADVLSLGTGLLGSKWFCSFVHPSLGSAFSVERACSCSCCVVIHHKYIISHTCGSNPTFRLTYVCPPPPPSAPKSVGPNVDSHMDAKISYWTDKLFKRECNFTKRPVCMCAYASVQYIHERSNKS